MKILITITTLMFFSLLVNDNALACKKSKAKDNTISTPNNITIPCENKSNGGEPLYKSSFNYKFKTKTPKDTRTTSKVFIIKHITKNIKEATKYRCKRINYTDLKRGYQNR